MVPATESDTSAVAVPVASMTPELMTSTAIGTSDIYTMGLTTTSQITTNEA